MLETHLSEGLCGNILIFLFHYTKKFVEKFRFPVFVYKTLVLVDDRREERSGERRKKKTEMERRKQEALLFICFAFLRQDLKYSRLDSTHYVAEAGLLASGSHVLELQACGTMPGLKLVF